LNKKVISALLILLFIVSVFSGCTGHSGKNKNSVDSKKSDEVVYDISLKGFEKIGLYSELNAYRLAAIEGDCPNGLIKEGTKLYWVEYGKIMMVDASQKGSEAKLLMELDGEYNAMERFDESHFILHRYALDELMYDFKNNKIVKNIKVPDYMFNKKSDKYITLWTEDCEKPDIKVMDAKTFEVVQSFYSESQYFDSKVYDEELWVHEYETKLIKVYDIRSGEEKAAIPYLGEADDHIFQNCVENDKITYCKNGIIINRETYVMEKAHDYLIPFDVDDEHLYYLRKELDDRDVPNYYFIKEDLNSGNIAFKTRALKDKDEFVEEVYYLCTSIFADYYCIYFNGNSYVIGKDNGELKHVWGYPLFESEFDSLHEMIVGNRSYLLKEMNDEKYSLECLDLDEEEANMSVDKDLL